VAGIDNIIIVAFVSASQWMIRFGALFIIPARREPEAAKGWLLLFFILPWPALILYQFIGRARHPRWRQKQFDELPPILRNIAGRAEQTMAAFIETPSGRCGETAKLARAIGGQDALGGNLVTLEPKYDRANDRMLADINNAKTHIHLIFYIFADDRVGERYMEALEGATVRGVKCRLVIDAIGSSKSAKAIKRRMEIAGVECAIALPVRLWGRVTRADLRNHRKIAVIDGVVGWTGSQNIVEPNSGASRPNRELMARVEGPVVAELQAVFLADWVLEGGKPPDDEHLFAADPARAGSTVTQVVASGPDHPSARIDLLFIDMIAVAERRIVITTPYFVPGEPLLSALYTAAMRGVEVQLILSGVSDSLLVTLAQEALYQELLANNIAIALCQSHFLHAKHISIDDRIAMIGSSNMDIRSSQLNAEVTLLLYDAAIIVVLNTVETNILATCCHLTNHERSLRTRIRATFGNIARLFAPVL
jgi:cardiolipin synthase A/B